MYYKTTIFNSQSYPYGLIRTQFNDNQIIKTDYIARTKLNGKLIYLGIYPTREEAEKAIDIYNTTGQRNIKIKPPRIRKKLNNIPKKAVIFAIRSRLGFERKKLVILKANESNTEQIKELQKQIDFLTELFHRYAKK